MARLFPNKLPGKVSLGVARIFRKLKKLPDDFIVWFSLSENFTAPHFLVLSQQRFAFLIQVAETSQEEAESALQANLFSTGEVLTPDEIGRESSKILTEFGLLVQRQIFEKLPVCNIVAFPNVDQNTLDAIRLQQVHCGEIEFLGMHQLGESRLLLKFEEWSAKPLSDAQFNTLRIRFSPESVVPESFSPLRKQDRNNSPTLFTGLLDLDQEWCAKNNLFLPAETREMVEKMAPANHHLISGVAGSGKSLVLLYRAMLNARLNPGARVLALTHNKPINIELQSRFSQIGDYQPNVEWFTFFGWARKFLKPWPTDIVSSNQTREMLIASASDQFSVDFLIDEIGFLKDHSIRRISDYKEMSRHGRGRSLNPAQREAVWSIFENYQRQLDREKRVDWHGVAMRFHDNAVKGALPFPQYDCILIDEAQFFAKAWFDIVLAALRPGGELFLAADPTQGFLKRRQSWLASGIDIRGRARCLRQAYRNSRAILRFAAAFCAMRKLNILDETDLNVPDEDQIESIPVEGSPPFIIRCHSEQDIQARAVNEIVKYRDTGLQNGQILVLHANSRSLDPFSAKLKQALNQTHAVHDAKSGMQNSNAFCKVCTLNAGTGLEAPIVFLLGIDTLLEREADPRLNDEQLADICETHTKQIYMALTRAGQQLIILTRNAKTAEQFSSLCGRLDDGIA